MRQTSILPALLAGTVFLFLTDFAHGQTVNGTNMAWQVRYHRANPNARTGDIALRLKVTPGTGPTDLIATLTRYDAVVGPVGSEKYQKRAGAGGQLAMAGKITLNAGGSVNRKREEFMLAAVYNDAMGKPHVVMVRGFHHTGRTIADRGDDVLCIRFNDRDLTALLGLLSEAAGPCDDLPPDEDVLSEDPVDDTMPPDPDYDGGP